jgi:hypothetical protein
MWVIQEPNKVALWNQQHFEEKKNGAYAACLKYSVQIFVEEIFKMQRLEVSGVVRHIYIYIYMSLGGRGLRSLSIYFIKIFVLLLQMTLKNLKKSLKWIMNKTMRCLCHRCWIVTDRTKIITVVTSMMNINLFWSQISLKIMSVGHRNNKPYALIYTTSLFRILAATCFGSSLPSSGSFLGPPELLEIQNRWYII